MQEFEINNRPEIIRTWAPTSASTVCACAPSRSLATEACKGAKQLPQPIVCSGKAEIFKPELPPLVSEARHVGDRRQAGKAEACLDRPDPSWGPDLPT